jgi:protein-disulfide isomerase
MKQKTLFIVTALALLVAFAVGVLLYTTAQEREAARLAEANRESLLRMHAPTLGPAEAPVTIVEFLDPACETCAAFYPRVKQLLAAHPDRIRLVLRWAPFHPGSDKVVAAIEAARRQGKLWPALEALLTSQREWTANHRPDVGRALARLQALGLDMERLSFDMTAPEIANTIAQDVADAQTLNVTKTPEFFVNGKPLPRFGWDELQMLVDEALAR